MAGPWEDYQPQAAQEDGPWADFAPATQEQPTGRRALASTEDGGTIWELSDGKRVFSSPNYSTSDPEQVAKLMEGATPADVSMSGWNDSIINQNPVEARALKAVEGTPFIGSYADEAVGAVYGDKARDAWRATSKAMDDEKPLQSAGLQLAGGLATGVPAAVVAGPGMAAQSLGGNMVRGAGLGVVEGATRGFGRGDNGAENRVATSATDAAFGGAVGLAVPAVAHGVGALASAFRNRLNQSQGISRIASGLGISPKASRLLSDTLEMDDLSRMGSALNDAGQDAMLADAGPTTRNALDFVTQAPGEGARTALHRIDDRATAAGGRLNAALDQSLTGNNIGAAGGRQFNDTARLQGDVRQSTAPARKAVYDAAYAQPIDYASEAGMRLEGLLKRVPAKAINDANLLMKLDDDASRQILASIADDGSVTMRRMPDVRQWDYIKRALDQAASTGEGQGAMGGQTPLGNAYKGLSRTIRQALGEAAPAYDDATRVAASAIDEVQAIKTGSELLRPQVTRAEAEAALDGMSGAERAAVKRGLRQSIDDAVANVRAVATDPNMDARETYKAYAMLTSRASQDKMKLLLGDDWHPLKTAIDETASALGLRAGVGGNSKTAQRGAFAAMLDDSMEPGAFRKGEPVKTAKGYWRQFTGSTPSQIQRAKGTVRNELADVLTRPNARATLDAIERARAAFPLLPDAGGALRRGTLAVGVGASPALAEQLRRRLLRQ
ncbi:hypothetical protein [Paracoccus litorisediminis]|uniref:Uncharacterized protein n=1 Tax=Paracoccus litorisediminis TaxID=2006130 RepID=A0A844HGB9_9RHOB|nr:hypothetical protein [Paracoccus litorisediminis]MTH57879.1 hypothetical protein [Paracoccus litorisediminis]